MTQSKVIRPWTFTQRIRNVFNLQRQYWTLWFTSRLRRTQIPQVMMTLASVLLSALVLCAIMVTIVVFDVLMLLFAVVRTPFQRKKRPYFPIVRTNAYQ